MASSFAIVIFSCDLGLRRAAVAPANKKRVLKDLDKIKTAKNEVYGYNGFQNAKNLDNEISRKYNVRLISIYTKCQSNIL